MTELRSTAHVPTARGDRWVKQLSAHLGRKAQVREDADGSCLLLLGSGTCAMSSDDTALRFDVTAPDALTLSRVESVVGGHLERFAAREGLRVQWVRDR